MVNTFFNKNLNANVGFSVSQCILLLGAVLAQYIFTIRYGLILLQGFADFGSDIFIPSVTNNSNCNDIIIFKSRFSISEVSERVSYSSAVPLGDSANVTRFLVFGKSALSSIRRD